MRLLRHARDLCKGEAPSRPAPASAVNAGEPLDQWEVVGTYYAPATAPVRSSANTPSKPVGLSAANSASSDAEPAAIAGDDAGRVPIAAPPSLLHADAESLLAARPVLGQMSARTAVRLVHVLADLGRHPEMATVLLDRVVELGTVDVLVDVVEVRWRSGKALVALRPS